MTLLTEGQESKTGTPLPTSESYKSHFLITAYRNRLTVIFLAINQMLWYTIRATQGGPVRVPFRWLRQKNHHYSNTEVAIV